MTTMARIKVRAKIYDLEFLDPKDPDDELANRMRSEYIGVQVSFNLFEYLGVPRIDPQDRYPMDTSRSEDSTGEEKRYGGPASSWGSIKKHVTEPDKCPDWKPCGMCGGEGVIEGLGTEEDCPECDETGCDYYRAEYCAHPEHGARRCDRRGR
jgi:hypothetical protein